MQVTMTASSEKSIGIKIKLAKITIINRYQNFSITNNIKEASDNTSMVNADIPINLKNFLTVFTPFL